MEKLYYSFYQEGRTYMDPITLDNHYNVFMKELNELYEKEFPVKSKLVRNESCWIMIRYKLSMTI